MKIRILKLAVLAINVLSVQGQEPIDVYESTLKVGTGSSEEYMCGFCEGDKLVFNFEETNGRELKEFEIVEMPDISKYLDYKISKLQNKTIDIPQTGIYKFRFTNGALTGRLCKFKIQRIPANEETKRFNPNVYTRILYDSIITPSEQKYLIRSDTSVVNIVDQIAKVSSQTAMSGSPNKTIIDFTLPEGTISWSFYIGVGNEGKQAFLDATNKFVSSATSLATTIPGYGEMAALALTGLSFFASVQGADNVIYYFITDWNSVQAFNNGQPFYQFKQGNVVNDASRMITPLKGKIYLGLLNDNLTMAIDVMIKITGIAVKEEWGTRIVNNISIVERKDFYLKN